jgi:hypothetical protein
MMLYRWLCAIALMSIGICTQSSAEDWPTRPIRAIVPFSASIAAGYERLMCIDLYLCAVIVLDRF